jgi:hypothetical protein
MENDVRINEKVANFIKENWYETVSNKKLSELDIKKLYKYLCLNNILLYS